jgi:hypothetical protein
MRDSMQFYFLVLSFFGVCTEAIVMYDIALLTGKDHSLNRMQLQYLHVSISLIEKTFLLLHLYAIYMGTIRALSGD